MSVYTTLTLQEVQAFAAPYELEVIDLIPIQGGIQNTNYFIVCENAVQYVLTVFE
ncbi:homoserine kinase, partial [Kaistia algarum]